MKFKFIPILAATLINSNILACEHHNISSGCETSLDTHSNSVRDILDVAKKLNWVSATDTDIKKAHCLRKTPFTIQEMELWMKQNDTGTHWQSINGIQFENESKENLKSFEALTKVLDENGGVDAKRQLNLKSKCKKVDCAVKEIFGKEVGVQLLFMQRRFGMNGSHISNFNSSPWRKSELDTILLGLSDYPEGVLPTAEDRPLMHYKRGDQLQGGDKTIANAVIEIFDVWGQQSVEQQRTTITHEIGHVIAKLTGLDDSEEWMNLSGWKKKTKIEGGFNMPVGIATKPNTLVSEYGKTNEWEDLAESVVAYRYNPALLKKASPEKYAMIKETIFDNVEYTSEESCSKPDRLSKKIKLKTEEKIKNWKPSEEELKAITFDCSAVAITNLEFAKEVDLSSYEYQQCYNEGLNKLFLDLLKKESVELKNAKFLSPLFRNVKLNIEENKRKEYLQIAQNFHRDTLRYSFKKAFSEDMFFKPSSCDDSIHDSAYRNYKSLTGDKGFRLRKIYHAITRNACKEILKKGTTEKKFTGEEITQQIEAMIK
jgi:hypothetical protein